MDLSSARFTTPRRELVGIPNEVAGKGVCIGIVDTFFPVHPDLARGPERTIQWLDAQCRPFDPERVAGVKPRAGQHGLGRAAVACGSGQASGGRYCGLAPECDVVLVNSSVVAGEYRKGPGAAEACLQALVDRADRLGVRAVTFGSAGARTGPLVPWQWDGQRRFCEQLTAKGVLVVAGTGNCPGSFSPTSLSPSSLAGGGLELPASAPARVQAFHSPEGVSFEAKAIPDCRVPAERVVVPCVDPNQTSGLEGVIAGHSVQEGVSFGDPFLLGLVACVWQKYPYLDARTMRSVLGWAARSVRPRFGETNVGLPTWHAIERAVDAVGQRTIDEPTPWERYALVRERSWVHRLMWIRDHPAELADVLLNSLPDPAPELAPDLTACYRRTKSPHARAAIVLLLAPPEGRSSVDHPLLDEALNDESPLVVGCALDAMRRRPHLVAPRAQRLAAWINHPDARVRYEALLAAESAPQETFVRPLVEGMRRDLDDGPLAALFVRRRCLQHITGQKRFPGARKMLPGECVYSGYWLGKQRECMENWQNWLDRS